MSFTHIGTQRRLGAAIIVALSLPAISACSGSSPTALPIPAAASAVHQMNVKPAVEFTFKTINDPADPTTEILGINNLNKLCGFYSNPNVGFVVRAPYGAQNFQKEIYPGARDTIVTSLNNTNTVAGWYDNAKGEIYGFTEWEGIWTKYQDPHMLGTGNWQVTKIIGLSDDDLAVGYYEDQQKIDHSFELNLSTGKFQGIEPPNAKSSAAFGINGKGDIVGWLTLASGVTEGWLLKGGLFTEFAYPAAVSTQASGLDWSDDIVGSFEDKSGDTHGFILTSPLTTQEWTKIDDPDASGGETVVASVNNHHSMVGYYQAPSGNINGFLAVLKKGAK